MSKLSRSRVAKIIRAARRRAGLSQTALGAKIGVSRYLISHIESGRRALHPRYIDRLGHLFGEAIATALEREVGDDIAS